MAVKPAASQKMQKIDELINKGAKVKADEKQAHEDLWKLISLRLPMGFLKEIDQAICERIGLSRNAWILEAIQEKLKEQR